MKRDARMPSRCSVKSRWLRAGRSLLIVGGMGLAALFFAACDSNPTSSTISSKADDLTTLSALVAQKVVIVEAVGKDSSENRIGTGFFVSGEGKVATCGHLIEGAEIIRVKTLSGAEFEFGKILYLDEVRDLAILSVRANGVAFFEQSSQEPSVGMQIAVLGNPLGLNGSLTDGVISAVRKKGDEASFLQISAPVSPGSSGSPVVSLSGELFGMVGARAEGGEGIGFALASGYIWEAINKPATENVDQAGYEKALEMSRKRYLPSRELWDDPEWNRWNLPKVTSQRIAVLRRLKSKYPDVALLRIEMARALSRDGNYKGEFEECAGVVSDDPGNRLAVKELIGAVVNEAQKAPYLRKARDADPLNFHVRQYLYERDKANDDFLSAQVGAREALATAPFSLRLSEGYAEALINYELSELAIKRRPFESTKGERIRLSINDSNEMRRMVAAASLVVSEPIEANLETFVALAREMPKQALPYVWELNLLGQTKKEIGKVLEGAIGERLWSFCQETIKNEPLIAEAYLLDPGSVNAREGLLYKEIISGWQRFFSSFGVVEPFDQIGMLFLLADHKANGDSETSVKDPKAIVAWVETLNAFSETGKALGGIFPRISDRGEGEWQEPLIFQFWLATQRRILAGRLETGEPDEKEVAEIKSAMEALRDIPSLEEAEAAIRALMKDSAFSIWSYYGDQYRIPLERAFEAAAAE